MQSPSLNSLESWVFKFGGPGEEKEKVMELWSGGVKE